MNDLEALTERLRNAGKAKKKRVDPDAAIKAMVAKSKKPKTENIYYLYPDDLKDLKIYIGRTIQTLPQRLSKHLSESKTGTSKKCCGLRAIQAEGCKINIGLIDVVDHTEAGKREDLEISNAIGSGLTLLNSVAACPDLYSIDVDDLDGEKTVWTVELFLNANWVKGGCRAKTGEWFATIGGVEWYRVGWSKMRFHHSVWGQWKIGGMSREILLKNAVAYFTQGTPQRKNMIEWCKAHDKF